MSKHTPGPWEVRRNYSNGCETCPSVVACEGWVADIVGALPHQLPTTHANARLIAAAPDLLAACEQLLADYVEDVLDGEVTSCGCSPAEPCGMCLARAAIARAKG